MFQSASPKKHLDGVAIVSAIMAAPDPESESRKLLGLIRSPPPFRLQVRQSQQKPTEVGDIIEVVPKIVKAVHDNTPLSHNMTNLVSILYMLSDRGRGADTG